ncbi:hypothetical protein [Virgibacillus sp. DJP39]|uniref:hypothetical protein n=1 Tax=Virgibacillus sp. DJP39 TaxID=3409790 RepID=UPI003BB645BA
MSLTEPSMANLVIKQLNYKWKAYTGLFYSLMILQLLAIIFSLVVGSGMSGGSSSSSGINVNIRYFSADTVVAFTILWAFISAILITTKAYREDDFIFVTNRVTANLSNMLFLGIASIIGAVTALLSAYLLKVLMYYVLDHSQIVGIGSGPGLSDFFTGLTATILYVFLFASLGYLVGTIVQLNRILVVVIPVLFLGFAFFAESVAGAYPLIQITAFYFEESSIIIFSSKIVVTIALVFFCSSLMSNRMEVRR